MKPYGIRRGFDVVDDGLASKHAKASSGNRRKTRRNIKKSERARVAKSLRNEKY